MTLSPLMESLLRDTRIASRWTGYNITPALTTENEDASTSFRIPLPGVAPESVRVELRDGWLQILAEQSAPASYRSDHRIRVGSVAADQVSASMEHGLLTVSVRRSSPAVAVIPVAVPTRGDDVVAPAAS